MYAIIKGIHTDEPKIVFAVVKVGAPISPNFRTLEIVAVKTTEREAINDAFPSNTKQQ
jgi:hypothetical protein